MARHPLTIAFAGIFVTAFALAPRLALSEGIMDLGTDDSGVGIGDDDGTSSDDDGSSSSDDTSTIYDTGKEGSTAGELAGDDGGCQGFGAASGSLVLPLLWIGRRRS
jgi:hypothetical protein